MRGMIKPLLGKITGRGEFFMGRGLFYVTANHPQPMTKLAKNDIITLKANRNLKGVRYHGKNTRDKKAGASQGMGGNGAGMSGERKESRRLV